MKTHLRTRYGFTLMEMVIIMPALTLLMVISIAWVYKTMQFASKAKAHRHHHQQLTRLAWDFRDAVNNGAAATVAESSIRIDHRDKSQTVFTCDANDLLVEQIGNDGTVVARERYELHPRARIQFDNSELPHWVILVVDVRPTRLAEESDDSRTSASEARTDLFLRCRVNRWEAQP